MQQRSLVLIDLSLLFRAAWHATEDLAIGEAYSRTVRDVHAIRSDHDLCAVCLDAPPYRRKSISVSYKAQRDAPPAQLTEQLVRVKERLETDGLLLWSAPGYEADDVIATAVRCALADDAIGQITIASSDKDLLALVQDPRVRAYSPRAQALFTEQAVREKFGVAPRDIPGLLALCGDSSDNVPGVPGCGPKTAAKLLMEHGGLQGVIMSAGKVPGKLGEALRANLDGVHLARRLVALEADAPIDFDALFAERTARPLVKDAEFDEVDEPEEPEARPMPTPPPATAAESQVIREPQQITQLAVRPAEWTTALEPTSTRDAFTMATHLHNSRMFSNFGSAEAVFAVILRGRSLGLDAATALSNFHVIEGKPTMHASLIVGLVLRSGKARFFRLLKSSDERATWLTHRHGDPDPIEMSFDIEDAVAAELMRRGPDGELRGVSKSGRASQWDKYRRTMLRWRAAVELARAVYPDVVTGLYTPDELSDGRLAGEA